MSSIRKYKIEVPDSALDDLKQRLKNTRWPNKETVGDWNQGVPLAYVQEVCNYWQTKYDWRRCEKELNALPQFITEIDGMDINFIHVKSKHDKALPLIITHGWPGSVLEFLDVIGPLTDPTAHGGKAEDAFHLVLPTMPGFGFSGKPTTTGWGIEKIGQTWGKLMALLGYDRYVAQGGDWGSIIVHSMAVTETKNCAAVHNNMVLVQPSEALLKDLTDKEKSALEGVKYYFDWDSGYSKEQSTRPQTLGYGLVDSPAGQAAWIIEKFWKWTDCKGHPENAVKRDKMLDDIMMYWLPAAGASSARLYWESFATLLQPAKPIEMPMGVSIYPFEIFRGSKRWCEERYKNLNHYNELDRGGHFAALEVPDLFVTELRNCFRQVRT